MLRETRTSTQSSAQFIFPPDVAGALSVAYLKTRKDSQNIGIRLGLKTLDEQGRERNGLPDGKFLLPLLPGELCTVLGRPGNGKTGFMVRWARYRADWLAKQQLNDRVVLYITLEQSVEELRAFQIAAERKISITDMARGALTPAQWAQCLEAGIDGRYTPLWFVGYSSVQRATSRIDMRVIGEVLERIAGEHILDMVLVDYLQRIPYGRAESKTIGVSDNLDELANLALQYSVPLVAGAQARREVDSYDPAIPGLDDGQWSSNIEQTSSKVLALARPAKYVAEGETFGDVVRRGTNQMIVAVQKQKLGADRFKRLVEFNPIYNLLDDLETRQDMRSDL